VDADDVHDALNHLHRLSLGNVTDTGTVRVHALVQRATANSRATSSSSAPQGRCRRSASNLPKQDFRPEYALLTQSLRDNADALHRTQSDALWSSDVHPVLIVAAKPPRRRLTRASGRLLGGPVRYC
jgi:hypothetical protein